VLANVGDSFVENRRLNSKNERDDIRSVGAVMMELMEPTTYILDPSAIKLKDPDKWENRLGVEDFLTATQHGSLKELKEHGFLSDGPPGTCLASHVFCALRAAKLGDWDVLSIP